jgi:16S rRNA (adenine1518-N6/adenine1519-N6)-dimethyltransferase
MVISINNKAMNLTSKKDIQNLLKKSESKPSKGFGQNFLVSEKKIKEIIEAADIQPDDTIIEIGPGVGNLTQELATKAGKVIAIEKDEDMIKILKETLKDHQNIEIIHTDILKVNLMETNISRTFPAIIIAGNVLDIIDGRYKVVANLPFYIATAIIRKFLEAQNPPELMILTVQKEVGQRICAKPPKMSLLAVSVQFYAEAKIISYISKKLFWPSPKVDSAIIKLQPKKSEVRPPAIYQRSDLRRLHTDLFFKIVKAGFSQPRKQLANNLAKNLILGTNGEKKINKEEIENWLIKNNIKPSQRAETLTLENWLSLAKTLP